MPPSLSPLTLVLLLMGGYLAGSIPFGVIATRLGGAGDVRQIGSGSIGATNVLRTGRRDLALVTVLGDALKGTAAVLVARYVCHEGAGAGADVCGCLAGAAAFLGHLFPVWLRFKGGKGVATFYGVLFAAAWPVGVAAAVIWLGMAAAFRFSSLAGLSAAALSPLAALLLGQRRPVIWLASFMALLIFIRHAGNIARLRAGTEPRIGRKPA